MKLVRRRRSRRRKKKWQKREKKEKKGHKLRGGSPAKRFTILNFQGYNFRKDTHMF